MAELAPSILQRFYRESSANDVFVAGPSGVAYTFPDVISNASDLAESTSRYMQRADLAIVNVIAAADCDADCALPYIRAGAQAVFLYTYGCAAHAFVPTPTPYQHIIDFQRLLLWSRIKADLGAWCSCCRWQNGALVTPPAPLYLCLVWSLPH
jgi:hypothetical protein